MRKGTDAVETSPSLARMFSIISGVSRFLGRRRRFLDRLALPQQGSVAHSGQEHRPGSHRRTKVGRRVAIRHCAAASPSCGNSCVDGSRAGKGVIQGRRRLHSIDLVLGRKRLLRN